MSVRTNAPDPRTAAPREAKPQWSDVPIRLRVETGRLLGSPVARAVRAFGGYAPSATYRLLLEDGRRAFLKATYPLPTGSGVRWSLIEEERTYRKLERYMRPWAPIYFGSLRSDGWHAVLLEDVQGESVPPWTGGRARRAARSYAEFHQSTHGRRLPAWLSRTQHREFGRFWSRLARTASGLDALASLAGPRRATATRWLTRALPDLVRAERSLVQAREPFSLLHFDTRSDNVRLEGERLRIFDWPYVSVGPHEFDLAAFAQAISCEDGPRAEEVVNWYAEILPVRERELAGSVAGIAGYFADRAPRPLPEGLPRIRSVQRRQLKASLAWAARILGLPEPRWLEDVPG
ncbi:MAG: hypothetical protein ACRDGT_02030 [Candidatus Limnocylindria bacterium]